MSDLKIEGIGSYSGGIFDSVSVDGVATINGDVSAKDFENDGVLTLNGDLDCKSLSCDGVMTISGQTGAEKIEIDGVMTFRKDLHCNSFSCDGTSTINGSMRAVNMEIDGTICLNGPVNTESFSCDGTATVNGHMICQSFASSGCVTITGNKFEGTEIKGDGVLSAPSAEISADIVDFEGRISASEIVGDSITIHSHGKIFALLGMKSHFSQARLIEATNVRLSGVVADEVNGENVYLNNGCKVERVDCSGSLHIDPSCKIGSVTGNYQLV